MLWLRILLPALPAGAAGVVFGHCLRHSGLPLHPWLAGLCGVLCGGICGLLSDAPVVWLQAILFLGVVLYGSARDRLDRLVPDSVSLCLLCLSLPTLQRDGLLPSLLGAGCVFSLYLLFILLFPGTIGGADVKFSVAASLLVGPVPGLFVPVLGMLLAVLHDVLRRLFRKSVSPAVPLIPYLGTASVVLFFIHLI